MTFSKKDSFSFEVSSPEHGKRLLQFLRDHLDGQFSVKAIKRAIESKKCTVNNQQVNFSTRVLTKGDVVCIQLEKTEDKAASQLVILYSDEDVLAVDKPAGVVSEESAIQTLLPVDKRQWRLVHRLDKETSGVLLLAKNEEILRLLIERFREKEVRKSYYAIVDAIVERPEGVIENLLDVKSKYAGQTIYGASTKGKEAITEWRCIKKGGDASLVECHPITGRTHQLRVHLSEMGHPILGDVQYGKSFKCSYKPHRHLLHAYEVEFTHPRANKKVKIRAPLPQDFKIALEELKLK